MSPRKTPQISLPDDSPAARIYRRALQCRARDLSELSILGELARSISELIHALQKERGTSSIFLGSQGTRFVDPLAARIDDSRRHQALVYGLLEHVDERLDQTSAGARFYARVALALRALDTLSSVREKISTLALAPQDAVQRFTDVIAALLAVGFEAADVAADPDTSRALVALVNFAQGKEYAGQERAVAGAAFSRGEFTLSERHRLQRLQAVQNQTFELFLEFASAGYADDLLELNRRAEDAGFTSMRSIAIGAGSEDGVGVSADAWYGVTTERIDFMKIVEDRLAADLAHLCTVKLTEATSNVGTSGSCEPLQSAPTVALFLADTDSAGTDSDHKDGIGLFSLRSMLDVIKDQARRIDDINTQLQFARNELAERKVIDRAKGILMRSRRLSEDAAYTLIRQTAMKQNKRMVEVAEAIVSMADILKA